MSARRVRYLGAVGGLLVALSVGLGSPSPARAAGDEVTKVEQLFAEGAALFNAGRFREALAEFEKAYAIYPAANLIFNMARCHEALGNTDLAIAHLERFLGQTDVDPRDRATAERKLSYLRRARTRTVLEGGGTRAAAAARSGAEVSTQAKPAAPERVSYSPWQYVALGAGVALCGGGAVALVLGMKDQDEVEVLNRRAKAGEPITRPQIEDAQDKADTKKLVGYVLAGVGAASLITGGVLLVLELTSKPAQPSENAPVASAALSFGLAPLPGGGGAATLAGRF